MERNPAIPFTHKYSQPFEYRFSLDSIEMAWEVAQDLKQRPPDQLSQMNVLDLCAGCGVIGFELNYHLPNLKKIDFLEVQKNYEDHFQTNRDLVKSEGQFHFLSMNYDQLLVPQYRNQYNLIICNPPYFRLEQGKLSPSEFKNRCRFFIDSSFEKLIESIEYCLSTKGQAYLLLRSLEEHDIDSLQELRQLIQGKLKCENLAMIRGTFLLKLYR